MNEKSFVRSRLEELCQRAGINGDGLVNIWSSIEDHYGVETRHYHTLKHIHDLLQLSARHRFKLKDSEAVDWSIIYHDIIYNPQSSRNEEDSAQLFKEHMTSDHAPNSMNSAIIEKVQKYIVATKDHKVDAYDHDSDLRHFLDWNMSIFAAHREEYRAYCVAVRAEYSHLSDEVWRQRRLAFLKGLTSRNGGKIYSGADFESSGTNLNRTSDSDSGCSEREAVSNIAWEMNVLEQEQDVKLSSPLQTGHYGSLFVQLPDSIGKAKPQKTKEPLISIKDDLGNYNVCLEGEWKLSEKVGNPTRNLHQSQSQFAEQFKQHDDVDVIIPDEIARPLLYTSQLLIISCVLAIVKDRFDLGGVIFTVYVTSILHWSKPRFSSIYRYLDYIAVGTAVSYGTYVSTTLETKYTLVWCAGIAAVGLIFVCNESLYYLQASRHPSGRVILETIDLEEHSNKTNENHIYCNCIEVPSTLPGTPEREWLYIRTVRVHALCIHVLTNALASYVLISMK